MLPKEVLFSYFPKNTRARYNKLIEIFSSLDTAWLAQKKDFKETKWKKELIDEFFFWKKDFDEEKAEKILEQQDIVYVLPNDPDYPTLLQDVYDPPFCLFMRGSLKECAIPLAVVGPRKNTPYGKHVATELVTELVGSGVSIVSGLAYGIDAIAHSTALLAKGNTIAVLGGGVDKYHITPVAHTELADRIVESGGAILSEFPPGTVPTKFTFPKRNRIVAGMSIGTLIIEAGKKSGALITAQCAIDAHRDVFAVPQNINSPNAIGVHKLIQSGAHLVTQASDILEILEVEARTQYKENKNVIPASPTEAIILQYITHEPIHIDMLIKKTDMQSAEVTSTLTLMEMKGMVKNIGNMMYIVYT
ncbi:MAG: DNA-protecting protein DprA [Candidatus Magasanikbacteria bacterium]|jgi:DNA processing protein|nr:DNA-protecting protein DprA [Candidatus Magasanikbacteria bacterium]